MLDDGLRVHCSVPGTPGISATLDELVKAGTVVTAYDDSLLRTVKQLGLTEGAELAPFSDLVGRFSRMWGVEGRPQATTGQRQAIVARVLAGLSSDSFLSASAAYPGSAETLVDVIRELEHAGLDADRLSSLETELEPRLARRLADVVAVIQSQATALSSVNRESSVTRIARCMADAKPAATPIKHVVCLTHGEHAPAYDEFLVWLAGRGVRVDRVDEPTWPGMFWPNTLRLGAPMRSHWVKGLFDGSRSEFPLTASITRASDALAESEWTIRQCLRLRQEGYTDGDLAILVRDTESYAPLLLATAQRLGVPLSASWSQPLLANGMAHTVLMALRSVAGPDVRSLGRVARSSHLSAAGQSLKPLWDALKQCFTRADRQWEELGSRLHELTDWAWLEPVLAWRTEALAQPASLTVWSGRLRLLGAALDVHPSSRTDDRDQRAQNLMQRSLLDVASTRSEDERLTLPQFVRIAESVWEHQRVTVDDRKGGVWVGNSAHAIPPVRGLFVLGMVEGVMPRRRSQEPVLGDDLREAINQKVGMKVLATSYDRASEERDEFLRICATPSDRILFTYPESDGESPVTPSYFLRAIAAKSGTTFEQLVEIVPRTAVFPEAENCLARQDLAMARALVEPVYRAAELTLTDPAVKDRVRLDPDQGVDLRTLGDYSDCPFRATVRGQLGLHAAHPPNPLYRLLDMPARAGLATAPTEHEAAARLHFALSQKLDSLYSELEPWESQLLKSAGERMIDAWVVREFAARKTWPRVEWQFEGFPVQSLRLGEGGTRGEISIGGGQTVPIVTDPMPVYQIGNFLVARWIESSVRDPSTKYAEDDDEESSYEGSSKWLRHGILLGFMAKSGFPTGLEIETLGSRRWMLLLAKGEPAPPQRVRMLERRDMEKELPEYVSRVSERARQTVKEMLAGNIEVRPGTVCRSCDYGGLCRRSSAILGDES